MTDWNHQYLDANGIRVHYVRHGEGLPLVLLHGWPEFWFTWRKNIPVLAEEFDVENMAADWERIREVVEREEHPAR